MKHTPLLSVSRLTVRYPLARGRQLTAIDDISLILNKGETLAIVGESGCGKSTLARAICGLIPTVAGEIQLQGEPVSPRRQIRAIGKHVQYVFQDPLDALDPRMTVAEILTEPLQYLFPGLSREERQQRITKALSDVAMSAEHLQRYPHEFSGGQAQRIGIARALVTEPAVLICDEPVSALDVSVQAQIINLLHELQQKRGLAMLFISHDLRVVQHLADRIMVLYLGRLMESGPAGSVFAHSRHPYTKALLSAIPEPDPEREKQRIAGLEPLHGTPPSPLDPPSGCAFRTRCPQATRACASYRPAGGDILETVNCLHTTPSS